MPFDFGTMGKPNVLKRINNDHLIAISIGLVYLWFGSLKFFPGKSPAEQLAKDTIDILTFGLIPQNITIILLAIWEVLVGLLLITYRFKKLGLNLAIVHIVLTFTPMFVLSELSFESAPIQPTLLGQYIFKNIVFLAIMLVLYRKNQTSINRD